MRVGLCAALIAILSSMGTRAEAATGVYLPGSRTVGAGITPPVGAYFQDDTYFYRGKIGGGTALPTGGLLVANVSATT